jgi:hypothetical protein
MNRLLRIFELSKSEQRVVLLLMLVLIAIAFAGYERRVHRSAIQSVGAVEMKASPTPAEPGDDQ